MSGKKKLPVLTETSCAHIDLIRKIAEVLTGKVARLKRYDFNTGSGQLYLDGDIQEFRIIKAIGEYHFLFTLVNLNNLFIHAWNNISLHDDGTLRIGARHQSNAHKREDGMPLWWVGDSATNRWEEPLFK